MTAPRHPQSVHHQGMTLQDLLELPTSAPVITVQRGLNGRALVPTARVTGQGPVRRLNALLSIAIHLGTLAPA